MIRRPPKSTLFPTRRSSDLRRSQQSRHFDREREWRIARIFFPSVLLCHRPVGGDRKSTRLNSSHMSISYAVFCLKKKKNKNASHHDSNKSTRNARTDLYNHN